MKFYSIILLIILLGSSLLYAQNNTDSLVTSLQVISKWTQYDDINIDSLVLSTGRKLTNVLKNQTLEHLDSLDNFRTLSSQDSVLIIYTFSYNSGGTRGDVDNPVIQWKKDNGSFGSYELFPANKRGYLGIETNIYKIYKLPSQDKNLYLLIGSEKGNSIAYNAYAIVVQIQNNYLILDFPAFLNESSTLHYLDHIKSGSMDCIACIDFDSKNNELIISGLGEEDEISLLIKGSTKIINTKKDTCMILKYNENQFTFKKFVPNKR